MDENFSPLVQTDFRRRKIAQERAARMKDQILPWTIAFLFACLELWCNSSIGSLLLSWLIPEFSIFWIEAILTGYICTYMVWMGCIIVNPLLTSTVPTTNVSNKVDMDKCLLDQSLNVSSNRLLNTSRRSDTSWVSAHQFGSSPGRQAIDPISPTKSILSGSFMNMSTSSSPTDDISMRSGSANKSKMMDSIHTREQLERLLRKDTDSSHLDISSSSLLSGQYSYYNILDIGAGERKGYQLSEQIPATGKDASGVVHFGPNGRVILSPCAKNAEDDLDEMASLRLTLQQAKNSPRKGSPLRRSDSIGCRRRSHSSPDRQIGPTGSVPIPEIGAGSGSLDDVDLSRAEYKLRFWIVNTVLAPLSEQIKKVNARLEKEHANPPLRIGSSSVDALRTALSNRESLRNTALPYILPYLSVHANQAYIVSRVAELCSDQFMRCYKWDEGGYEPSDEKSSLTGRLSRRKWSDALPTDSSLVAALFFSYMDSVLTSNPLVGSSAIDQPFTAVFTVKYPQKPGAVHMSRGSFYVHMTSASPTHWELVSTDSSGVTVRTPVVKGSTNLFHVLIQFVHHAKTRNGGRIDMMSIGPTGLNIGCVLQ